MKEKITELLLSLRQKLTGWLAFLLGGRLGVGREEEGEIIMKKKLVRITEHTLENLRVPPQLCFTCDSGFEPQDTLHIIDITSPVAHYFKVDKNSTFVCETCVARGEGAVETMLTQKIAASVRPEKEEAQRLLQKA
jgi:hypothetical protein